MVGVLLSFLKCFTSLGRKTLVVLTVTNLLAKKTMHFSAKKYHFRFFKCYFLNFLIFTYYSVIGTFILMWINFAIHIQNISHIEFFLCNLFFQVSFSLEINDQISKMNTTHIIKLSCFSVNEEMPQTRTSGVSHTFS